MPISRQQLEHLQSLGVTDPYTLISGDNTHPLPTDTFQPNPNGMTFGMNAGGLLDTVRNTAGMTANPNIPSEKQAQSFDSKDFLQQMYNLGRIDPKPIPQTNILDQLRADNGVKGQVSGDIAVPDSQKQPQAPVFGQAIQNVLDKATKKASMAARNPAASQALPEDDSDEEETPKKAVYNSKADLLNALKAASSNDARNSILEGAIGVGAALGRSQADYTGLDSLKKQGQKPLEAYQDIQNQKLNDQKIQEGMDKQELGAVENDPNSEISKTVRDALGKLGLQVPENTSAKQLKDQGVDISKLMTAKESAESRKLQAQMMGEYRNGILDQKQTLQDQRINNQVLRAIDNNPNVKTRITQIQNLDNAMAMLQAFPEGATPQQIADAQQLIVRNMGITGQSGVNERAERYIHTAGMKGAGLLQFLTGDPVLLSQNSNLMNYIRHQASTERANANQQLLNTINIASAGHGSLYARRPELLDDLKDKLSSYQGIMAEPVNASAPASIGSPVGQASGKPQTVTQNGHVYHLNASTGQYE